MTAKEALNYAISRLSEDTTNPVNQEAITALNKLAKRDLIAHWSQAAIIQALNEWMSQNGRPPSVTNLIEPGMPGANIIQKYFGVRASLFLSQLYGSEYRRAKKREKYHYHTQAEWLECFRTQFLKHCGKKGFSSKTYNKFRDPETPAWYTIATHCDTTHWDELMSMAGVSYTHKRQVGEVKNIQVVAVKSPWLERYEDIVRRREETDRLIIESISIRKGK